MESPNNIPALLWAGVVIGGPILLGLAILLSKFWNGARREGLDKKGTDPSAHRDEDATRREE
jgi:hypothetical protein